MCQQVYNSIVLFKVMLNIAYITGEPLNEEVIYNWEEATGLVVKEGYGQTETTLLLGTFKVRNNTSSLIFLILS